MFSNYLKVAWRNLVKNKGYSVINIAGLATGMAVAMLIGLWVYDELAFDTYHPNYSQIAQVMYRETVNGKVVTGGFTPVALGEELRNTYKGDFSRVVRSSWSREHILAYGDKKVTRLGNYLEPQAPDMLGLEMVRGSRAGLAEPASILLAQSVAQALFGQSNPMGKIVTIDNKLTVSVTGVYQDLPYNTQFRDMLFIAPWSLYVSSEPWLKSAQDKADWTDHSWQTLVQLAPNADLNAVSAKIRNLKLTHDPTSAPFKPEMFLHAMRQWHLYSEWDQVGQAGGRIQYVWLFGIIGGLVLLLACINFMNLSTARSEKRAKEVGIRKAVGSVRSQLVAQFFGESFLVVALAFLLTLLVVALVLPLFNQVADKQITILWTHPLFWLAGIGFSLLTGALAGSYPALYLSSFRPVKVLKGTFRAGRLAAIPRQALVVVQFSVSVTLIIGTIVVFRQLQHAQNRPIGYERNGLITVAINTPELQGRYNALRPELLQTGAVVDMSTSSSPTTSSGGRDAGFQWAGKDPGFKENFAPIGITHDYGKTVDWHVREGRDFSRQFTTDSTAMMLNQTAVAYMGLKNPVGQTVLWHDKAYQVIGVIDDMVMGSPFEPVYPTVFTLNYNWANIINIKLNPALSARESLGKIEAVFQKFNPGSPFEFKFTDQQYGLKFAAEERIGKLALVFTALAILISCLGLFGLASFMAEQRTKEIGVRKALGATVFNVWGLLSQDFLLLVAIAFVIAAPTAYYALDSWLAKYAYRTELSWWIFAASGMGAFVLTLVTISYQGIKAALMDPVKSLRSE